MMANHKSIPVALIGALIIGLSACQPTEPTAAAVPAETAPTESPAEAAPTVPAPTAADPVPAVPVVVPEAAAVPAQPAPTVEPPKPAAPLPAAVAPVAPPPVVAAPRRYEGVQYVTGPAFVSFYKGEITHTSHELVVEPACEQGGRLVSAYPASTSQGLIGSPRYDIHGIGVNTIVENGQIGYDQAFWLLEPSDYWADEERHHEPIWEHLSVSVGFQYICEIA